MIDKISFLISVNNKSAYLPSVIKSLYEIKGDFWKEFIFVDDGSTDDSLEIIKADTKFLRNTTIILKKNHYPADAMADGIKIALGKYIFFMNGEDCINPDAPALLLNLIKKHNISIAFGLKGQYDYKNNILIQNKKELENAFIIKDPIKEIFKGKIAAIRSVGTSGSMISKSILKKIGYSDKNVFEQDLSLSLRCATVSEFIYLPQTVSYSPIQKISEKTDDIANYNVYNNLLALQGFIKFSPEQANLNKNLIHKFISSIIWKSNKQNIKLMNKYIISKLFKYKPSINELDKLINEKIKIFF